MAVVTYDRRTVLRGTAIGLLGTSTGCLQGLPGSSSDSDESRGSTSTCEEGRRRLAIDLPGEYELEYRYGFNFELNADPSDQTLGETVTLQLKNTADESQTTSPQSQYALERRVEDGWRHVLWVPQEYSWPNETVTHQPGEGFSWQFPFTQEGLSQDPFQVCEALQPGEYHFTYWGFPTAKRGLTIGFEVTQA